MYQLSGVTKYRDDILLKKFGENLRKIRLAKGLSQEFIATRAGIPVSQIGRIERGEINTTISTAYLLSNVLEVKIEYLFMN